MTNETALLAHAGDIALVLGVLASLGLVAPGVRNVVVDPALRRLAAAGLVLVGIVPLVIGLDLAEADNAALLLPAVVGVASVVWSARRWTDREAGVTFQTASAIAAIAAVVQVAGAATAGSIIRLGAAAVLGRGVYALSRRSIPARITGTTSLIIFVVTFGISISIATVVVGNVRDEALARAEARAVTEADLVSSSASDAFKSASVMATSLANNSSADLDRIATDPDHPDVQRDGGLADEIDALAAVLFSQGPVLYLTPGSSVVVSQGDLDADDVVELAGSDLVRAAVTGPSAQSIIAVGERLLAAGAAPVQRGRGDARRVVGVVVVSDLLSDGYLLARRVDDGDESLALVTPTGIAGVAGHDAGAESAGSVRDRDVVAELGRTVGASGTVDSRTDPSTLTAAAPVLRGDGRPVAAVVLELPSDVVNDTRDTLLRLTVLGAVLTGALGVALAAGVGRSLGDRVGGLAIVARRMESGDLTARVDGDEALGDEITVLSGAFNSMAGSIEEKTDQLLTAAVEEARLRGRLVAVVDGMGEALVATDAEGIITDTNTAAEMLLGMPAGDIIGRPMAETVRLVDVDNREPVVERLLATRQRSDLEGFIVARREEIPVVVTVGPITGAGASAAGHTFVLRDVRREQEVERMKTEFLQNTGHELRTPLTTIKGWAAIVNRQVQAGREVPTATLAEAIRTIVEGSLDLERRIDQLVRFAELTAGRLALRPEAVPVRPLLDGVVARWEERAGGSHVFKRRVARAMGPAMIDVTRIDACLDELVDNAVKFSPKGSTIMITGEVVTDDDGVEWAGLTVADRGVGIPEDHLDEIVKDFVQGDGSATRQYGGLGLGLPTVDRIARAHGGELRFTSTEGKGSRFTIVVPMDKPDKPRRRSARTAGRGGTRSTEKPAATARTRRRRRRSTSTT